MVGLRNIEELESDEPIVQYSEEELHWLNSPPLRYWLNSPPLQHTYSPRLFLNENGSEEENPNEDFGLGCSEAAKNIDEVEAVGNIGSERTGDDCVMVDQLNSECLGKKKTKEKNPVGERRNKKTNRVRIAIPLEDILQTKGMRRQDAAKYLKVSIAELKSSCREYGIHRWPPRNEHIFIKQSLSNETPTVVNQEGFPQLSSHIVPSTQALTATVDTNSFFEKEILLPQFLPTAQQQNLDAGLGNDKDEAIGMGVEGIGDCVMVEAQLNSGCSRKGKFKEKNPGGERGNKGTTGVRIAIAKEDILQFKGMRLKDVATLLRVSRSTLKRVCREYNIYRWPPRKENELIGQSRPNESPAVVDQEQIAQLNSDTLLPSNKVSATIDTNSVKVKVCCEEGTIKFRLSCPWRMEELEQKVKKRLSFEAGTYNIYYKDEDDDDYTLIKCDEDLEEYISNSSWLGTHSIELFHIPK